MPQGDPLGPLLFALALRTLVSNIEARWPYLSLRAWYSHGGTMIGKRGDIVQILSFPEGGEATSLRLQID